MKLGNKDAKSIDELGHQRPKPGQYFVVVKSVDESFTKKGAEDRIIVEFEVLSGTVPGQAGKTHSEYFSVEDKHLVRLTRLCMATGLLLPGEEKDVDLQQAKGRPLVVTLSEREYEKDGQKKTAMQVDYHGMWPLEHPDVAAVPKDKEAMAVFAMAQGRQQQTTNQTAPNGQQGQGHTPQQQSAPVHQQQSLPGTQPAAGGNRWGSL